VTYELAISEAARDQLRRLPQDMRRNIGYRLHLLQQDLTGDVRKIEGQQRNHYRLRVGIHRVLFRLNGGTIEVYAVRQMKEAYE
jgi:mRNA-degrading endonuclease RelE of RelBE toxin-antitoxin system